MKKGLIFMALCLCFASVASYSATVWSSDVAFDGTPTTDPVVLKPTDNIGYTTATINGDWKCVTVRVSDSTDPSVQIPNSGTIFQTPHENVEFEGSFNWNYTSLNLPDKDTYKIEEELESTSVDIKASRYFTIVPEPTVLLFVAIVGAFFLRRRAKALLAAIAMVALCSFSANATTTVSSVNCLQLFPVHREVVINYTITTDSAEDLTIKFYGSTDKGATTFDLADKGTLTKDGASGKITTGTGTYKTIWTPDSTMEEVTGTIRVGVEVEEYVPPQTFMILGLSDNTISYTDTAPSGGWNVNDYKTTKMVLRYVPAGNFQMGSPDGEVQRNASKEESHKVNLTKGFYIGIFEVTQEQYSYITSDESGHYTGTYNYNNNKAAAGAISYEMLRGNNKGAGWPNGTDITAVDDGCILDKLRKKFSNEFKFDLPTEAQWEYACRAGTTRALNNNENLTNPYDDPDPNMELVGSYTCNNCATPETVGNYLVNGWGLYDMHGNISEWCLDWYAGGLGTSEVTDPKGADTPVSIFPQGNCRMTRGGDYMAEANDCRSASRTNIYAPSNSASVLGFRVVLTVD